MAKLTKAKVLSNAVKILIFGNPKTGKTHQLGKLLKHSTYNIIWFDLDNGIRTLIESPELGLSDADLERVDYYHIPDTYSNPIAISTVTNFFRSKMDGYICEEHGVWNCPQCMKIKSEFPALNASKLDNNTIVVIDSGTRVSESARAKVLNNSNLDPADLSKAGNDKASYGVYMGEGAMLHSLLSNIQNCNFHVIVTAHEQEAAGDDKVKKLYPTIGTSNFAPKVAGYFTNVIHLAQANKKFVVESANNSSLRADVGGQINVDLNAASKTLADYFSVGGSVSTTDVNVGLNKFKAK